MPTPLEKYQYDKIMQEYNDYNNQLESQIKKSSAADSVYEVTRRKRYDHKLPFPMTDDHVSDMKFANLTDQSMSSNEDVKESIART